MSRAGLLTATAGIIRRCWSRDIAPQRSNERREYNNERCMNLFNVGSKGLPKPLSNDWSTAK